MIGIGYKATGLDIALFYISLHCIFILQCMMTESQLSLYFRVFCCYSQAQQTEYSMNEYSVPLICNLYKQRLIRF